MKEEKLLEIIHTLQTHITETLPIGELSDEALKEQVEEIVRKETMGLALSIQEKVYISEQICSNLIGLGFLDLILKDDSITEVMINGPDHIFIEKNGRLTRLNQKFANEKDLFAKAQTIAGRAGREVNDMNPIVDTRLKDGSRVNIVLPPISLCGGAVITIRKFSKKPMTMEQLIRYGSLTPDIAEILKTLVEAKFYIFISGGTGSGKTTYLNALSNYIPGDERVITIEDSAELQIVGVENLVSLETKNAGSSGGKPITIRDLIKSSLRMRPERIVVGEVRGEEALDMLQAMNTGHDGSLSTGHANSARDMLSRLETMVLQGAAALPLEAIRQQIASALDIIIHLARLPDHSRKTMEITQVLDYKDGEIRLNPLFVFQQDPDSTPEKVTGRLVRTGNRLENPFKLELAGKKLDL